MEAVLLDEVAVAQAQRDVRHAAQPAVHLDGAVDQGLTLVRFSARCEHCLWDTFGQRVVSVSKTTQGFHSSTYPLNVSIFCRIHWVSE